MRWPSLALLFSCLLCACVSDPAADGSDAGDTEDGGETTATSDDGTEASGDGDGDGDPPVPEQLPTPTGTCPSFSDGYTDFAPASIDPRAVRLWVGDNPQPGGMLVIYWHAYMSAPEEAAFTLSAPVIQAIVDAGGVVAAPVSASDSGEFPWFIVNGSTRPDDMLLGDEIVACAIQELGIDPRRIHATGMSAGGLQTTGYTMMRSRYIASSTSFSGGAYTNLPFEDSSNKFAAMIIHGGDTDIFGGAVNFENLSTAWYNQLTTNGNFAFMCDHGMGHSIPPGYGASVVNFFFAHPFGTTPSPYVDGLPAEFPADCAL